MIYIKKNTASTVVVTACLSATIINPYYLFKITSNINEDMDAIYVAPTDTSLEIDSYNEFSFNLDIPTGEYTYEIYESENADPVDENDTTGTAIETGLLIVEINDDLDNDIYL